MSGAVLPPAEHVFMVLTWTALCLLLVFSISILHHGIHEIEVIIDDLEYLKEVEGRITIKIF